MHTLAMIVLHVLAERVCYTAGKSCSTWFPESMVLVPQLLADASELQAIEAELDGCCASRTQLGVEVTRDDFLDALPNLRDRGLIQMKNGTVSLTLDAVRDAIRVRPYWSRENVTKFWVKNRLEPSDYKKMQAILARKTALKGREVEILNSHLLALMSRDGLQIGLLRGQHPTLQKLAIWAIKSEMSAFSARKRDALSWCDTVSAGSPPGHREQTSEFPAGGLLVVPSHQQPLEDVGVFGGKVSDLSITDGRSEVENLLLYGDRQLNELGPLLKRVDLRNMSDITASRSVDAIISEGLDLNRRAAGTLRDLSRTPTGLPIRETALSNLLVTNGWVVSADVNNRHLRITPKGRNALVGWDSTDPFYALRT